MPEIHQSTVVGYSATQMFDLVDKIEDYPQFVPWCESAVVVTRNATAVRACLAVRKGALHYTFTTDNYLQPPDQLELRLVDGPFKHLAGMWRFVDNAVGSRVSLDLKFEFSNRLLAVTLSPLFKAVTGSMVDAFKRRAAIVYAPR